MFLTTKCGSILCQARVSSRIQRSLRKYGKMSRLYCPVSVEPPSKQKGKGPTGSKKDQLSKSQKLMLDNGLMQLSNTSGTYHLLPIAVKALEKLIRIIDMFMEKAECQKIRMPILASSSCGPPQVKPFFLSVVKNPDFLRVACMNESLLCTLGRLENFGPELMMLKDRHEHSLVLCPTHEEVICDLLALQPLSHRTLPLKLYQITEKFRDEKRPRFGLLRGREFLMKDLYTFDADEESAQATYDQINSVYSLLFNYIGVKFARVEGSAGLMGGNLSHEFHLISDVGEDKINVCNECQFGYNQEIQDLAGTQESEKAAAGGSTKVARMEKLQCTKCGSKSVNSSNAIEVAHSFLLGTKYTKAFQTSFHAVETSSPSILHMGCYGIGVTRLLASVIEVLSTQEEIRWPSPIAPYLVALIPPKNGSKEAQSHGMKLAGKVNEFLMENLSQDLLIDDRTDLTIGRRLKDIKRLGIPYAIVCGKQLLDEVPKIELIDIYNNTTIALEHTGVFRHLYDLKSTFTFL